MNDEVRPRFNQHDFTCPGCLSHFLAGTMRIAKRDGRWHCRRCAFGLNATTGTVASPAKTFVKRVETTKSSIDRLAEELCANCHRPFAHRRIIIRADGTKVHYRCPNVTRAMRRAAQTAASPPS